ncbi:uracil-DNA glycosylase [Strigomonas culicis]|uniref:Uracil-DNA glycosylase n=1 Tax=Strigomonas culicis TaxID=28005 RepID=S9WCD4_9TRYP|nr:uracil-DNA glycosylase [Strigomonas culicis]|eukprot:EPY33710.1 uracil-DNA glycosylase [Strigomonas culicis]
MIFTALNRTPLEAVKVVLLGQDPYHDVGQAHGLCFSVQPGVPPPPSLRNMYKELAQDIPGFAAPPHGYLQSWADQGVLMLNATLTVNAHEANSHSKCGWQDFTDAVIQHLSRTHKKRVVFLLWGNFAKKKAMLVDRSRHVVIESAHPSPLSARHWFGCRCFSKCNEALQALRHAPINWHLPPRASLSP